jgi:hypothetical protein
VSENVSVLLVIPSGSENSAAVQEVLRGISSQTYPSSLIDLTQVQYVPSAPGAHTSALNATREDATGEFVVQAEPGVVWDGNKLERQVSHLQTNPHLGATVHGMTLRDPEGRTHALDLDDLQRYGPHIGSLLGLPWGPGAAMFRQEVYSSLGVYRNVDEALWEHSLRFLDKGHKLEIMAEDLAVWNLDSDVVSVLGTRSRLVPDSHKYDFLKSYLGSATVDGLIPGRNPESSKGNFVLAALMEKNDDLESCHRICQEAGQDDVCGNYWHGIVHRREPDFENARGWFRRTEGLTAYTEIYTGVLGFLQRVLQVPEYGEAREKALAFMQHLRARGSWDPIYLVDMCEACLERGSGAEVKMLEEIQEVEFDVLFGWTYASA